MQRYHWFSLFLVLAATQSGLQANVVNENVMEDRVDLTLTAGEAVKMAKQNVDWIIKRTLPTILEASENVKLNSECVKSLMTVVVGLKQMKDWAAKMLDASSKIPSGILLGTTTGLGSYDECVDIVVTDKKRSKDEFAPEKFRGQYCTVNVWPPKSLGEPIDIVANSSGIKDFNSTFWKIFPERSGFGARFRIAIAMCIPSTCSKQDLSKLATHVMRPLGFGATINNCIKKAPITFDKNQLAIMGIFLPLLFIILAGTILDAILIRPITNSTSGEKRQENAFVKTVTAFSLIKNTKKLLDVYRSDNSFGALAGIRFFSITWIILGHSYYFPHLLHYAKFKDMFTVTETQFDLTFMVIQNTALAVDSFFLVSGFLTTHSALKSMKKTGGKLNAITFFLKRIIRMLPAQFLIMGVLFLLPLFGSGPLWIMTWDQPINNCVKSWWSNILFIQNFWGLEKMCLFHTWFLAIAMQLHVVAFFILIILYRWPVFGIAVNVLLTIGGAVGVGLVTLFYKLPPTFSTETKDFPKFHDFYDTVYIQVYSHFGSYCIGVLMGYYMLRKPDSKPNIVWRMILWVLATILGLLTVYGLFAFTRGNWSPESPLAHVSYAATFRTGWALAVAWVIFDCATRNDSMINQILSWQPFAVLDRLTFMAYLLHPLVMYYYQARLRELLNTDYIDMIYYFLATTMVTYIVSFFFHVAVEQPINFLDAIFFGPKRTPQPESTLSDHEQNLGIRGQQYIPDLRINHREKHHDFRNVFVVANESNGSRHRS